MGFREYARYLSFHFPFTHERSLLEHLRALPWRLDTGLFKARPSGGAAGPVAACSHSGACLLPSQLALVAIGPHLQLRAQLGRSCPWLAHPRAEHHRAMPRGCLALAVRAGRFVLGSHVCWAHRRAVLHTHKSPLLALPACQGCILQPSTSPLPWPQAPVAIRLPVQAWRQGRTGYPLVDAGMRQLWSTGWLHNRWAWVSAVCWPMMRRLSEPWRIQQLGLPSSWPAALGAAQGALVAGKPTVAAAQAPCLARFPAQVLQAAWCRAADAMHGPRRDTPTCHAYDSEMGDRLTRVVGGPGRAWCAPPSW